MFEEMMLDALTDWLIPTDFMLEEFVYIDTTPSLWNRWCGLWW